MLVLSYPEIKWLGSGKIICIISKNPIKNIKVFFLYPSKTIKVANFKDGSIANDNPNKEAHIRFCAECISSAFIDNIEIFRKIDPFTIWTKEHIEKYVKHRGAWIHILRVYKTDRALTVKRKTSQTWLKMSEPIFIKNKPILTDKEFNLQVNKIKLLLK